jgi:uncharacterized protein YbjT (DUF2867 family)
MRILVPGATGTVGGHVVEQALGRGHEVVALARDAARLDVEHPRLTAVSADLLDHHRSSPCWPASTRS